MNDAIAGWHDLERVERLHSPFHELIALLIALELEAHVEVERVLVAVVIDLYRVVHHQVDRDQRLDHFGVLAHLARDSAHRGEIGEERHPGKILQHDPRDNKWNLVRPRRVGLPAGKLPHVLLGDLLAVAVAQDRFEHDPDRYRQARNLAETRFLQRGERVVLTRLAGGELELLE